MLCRPNKRFFAKELGFEVLFSPHKQKSKSYPHKKRLAALVAQQAKIFS